MKLILHVGPPKTGSSAIQIALRENVEVLQDAGIFHYAGSLEFARSLSTYYQSMNAVPGFLGKHFDTIDQAKAWSADHWLELEKKIKATRPEFTILSSEHFAQLGANDAFVSRLKGMFDEIFLIAYARDPVSMFVSSFDQGIRGGQRISQFFGKNENFYAATGKIQAFEGTIGREHMFIRDYAREALVGGDVVTDFFDVVSRLTSKVLRIEVSRSRRNESLAGAATAWLALMNEVSVHPSAPADLRASLKRRREIVVKLQESEALRNLPRLSMTDAQLTALIRKRAQATSDWLYRSYFPQKVTTPIRTGLEEEPDPLELRARLRDWMLAYLTPDAIRLIGLEIVDLV